MALELSGVGHWRPDGRGPTILAYRVGDVVLGDGGIADARRQGWIGERRGQRGGDEERDHFGAPAHPDSAAFCSSMTFILWSLPMRRSFTAARISGAAWRVSGLSA